MRNAIVVLTWKKVEPGQLIEFGPPAGGQIRSSTENLRQSMDHAHRYGPSARIRSIEVAVLVRTVGEVETARRLGVSLRVLARALAGLEIPPSTGGRIARALYLLGRRPKRSSTRLSLKPRVVERVFLKTRIASLKPPILEGVSGLTVVPHPWVVPHPCLERAADRDQSSEVARRMRLQTRA